MKIGMERRWTLAIAGVALILALGLLPGRATAQLLNFPDWYTLANAAADNKPDYVRFLLSRGDSPNFTDSSGRTPLDYAAIQGNAQITKMLIDGGARTDFRDNFGATPLHWAAENGRIDVAKLLIAAKAPIDAVNKQGITPLMMAAGNDKSEMAKLLLRNGADPKKQDFTGRDASGWAAGSPAVLRLLASKSG